MRPSNALLMRLLMLLGPASIAACGGDGGASNTGSTTNANSGAGGVSETGGSGGAAGVVSGGSGGSSAGAGGAAGGAGIQSSCADGEKRLAQQFCPTPSCTDVMMEACDNGQWVCYQESCPPTGGAGGGGGAAGSEAGGSGGFGGYSNPVCPDFCTQACAQTTGSCGPGTDPDVVALFKSCPAIYGLSAIPTQTIDSTGVTTCCWFNECPGGRPLSIEGVWTQAPTARRGDWS